MHKGIIGVVTVGIIALGGYLFIGQSDTPSSVDQAQFAIAPFEVGSPMPAFVAMDFDGNEVRSEDLVGKPVILDFWAAWCVFCREEMPILQSIHASGDDVTIIGVHRTDSGESVETGKEFADEQGVTYPLLIDDSGALYKAVAKGLQAMPVAVYSDSTGVITDITFGPKTEEDIRTALQQ